MLLILLLLFKGVFSLPFNYKVFVNWVFKILKVFNNKLSTACLLPTTDAIPSSAVFKVLYN